MYCLVVGQTLRTFKSLVTLRALVEPLLFIGASAIRPANKVIVPETCDRGENKKLGHAEEIYIAPEIHSKLAQTVTGLDVAGQVASGGLDFSTLLTSCFSLVHCRVVRQALVGREGLFTHVAMELLG